MTVTGVLLLTLSAVTPASSVFVIIPGIIAQAGTGAFISLTAAALVALAMALVYAELASAFPHAGGEYAMMGRTLGPFVGYVFMGMNVIGSTLAPAVLALGAADYVGSIWPNAPRTPFAMGIVAVSMLLGVLNIRLNAWVTGVFLLVEMVALVVLAGLGFTHIHRSPTVFLIHPLSLHLGQLTPTPIAMMGLATAVAVFSYNGFGAAVYFSEEMHEAPKRVARTILLALALTVAFEFVPVTAVLMGSSDLRVLLGSPAPFSAFLRETGGAGIDTLVSLGIALAIVNAVIATVLMNARFLFSSGRDGIWNGVVNSALVRIHGRFQSPWIATLLAGASAMVACLIPFHVLLVMNGAGVVLMYLLLCLGAIAGRVTGATAHAAYRMPLFPVAPVFALLTLGYVVYANWLDLDVGRPSLVFSLALVIAATGYFLLLRRRRGGSLAMTEPSAEP